MEVIMIKKERFESLFKKLEKDLQLTKYDATAGANRWNIQDIHRKFNYHVSVFKDRLEKSQ